MVDKAERLAEEIRQTMEHAVDWERKRTSIPGIYIVRPPDKAFRIMLEFNPPDDAGTPTKRKGLYFMNARVVDAAKAAFTAKGIDDLIAAVELINAQSGKRGTDEDVFKV